MAVTYAVKTKAAITANIEADQGASFRVNLGRVIPHMGDAFRGADEGFRSHLGASMIGRPCAREIWYGFRWAVKSNFGARMIRLFNRGHLEEARFIAMLQAIGVTVYQQDEQGRQFRISSVGGHFGGSGDGVGVGIPDLAPDIPCLLEFKTHNDKSFQKLVKEGVRNAKPEHFVQMQTYMRKMQLNHALYGAVNKNDDELHLELVFLDPLCADQFLDRGRQIIMMRTVPERIANASPGLFTCKYCDKRGVCFDMEQPEKNCRTCYYAEPKENGTWMCNCKERQLALLFPDTNPLNEDFTLTKSRQLTGCEYYVKF